MSFPDTGSYYTFHLDPIASLQDIEDEEVAKAARALSPQVYVACTLEAFGVPRAPPAYEAAHISLVQQGLPVDSPEEFLESRIKVSDVPYWQIKAAQRAERQANRPDENPVEEPHKNDDAASDYSGASCHSGGGGHDSALSASSESHSGTDTQGDAAMDAPQADDDIADAEDDILAAINYQSELRDVSPVIIPLSYDLSSLDAPPSPAGFLEELKAINRIRSEYEERVRRLKDEIRRRDDEYMAGIEARRTAEEAQSTSPAPAQSRWLSVASFVPLTNKLKAHLDSDRLEVNGSARKVSGQPGSDLADIRRYLVDTILSIPLSFSAQLFSGPTVTMSFPDNGSYSIFRLDPIASLQDIIHDEDVMRAAHSIPCNEYVACMTIPIGAPHPPPAYTVAYIDLVQQGLPSDDPEQFLESRMCVPIRPNAHHPDDRRPVRCCNPLPWDDCYHVAAHRTHVRVQSDIRDVDPPHSLSPSECLVLHLALKDDQERQYQLCTCAATGSAPPAASVSSLTQAAIRNADRKSTDVPFWQQMRAEKAARAGQSTWTLPNEAMDRYLHGFDDTSSEETSSDYSRTSGNDSGLDSSASDTIYADVVDNGGVKPAERSEAIASDGLDAQDLALDVLRHRPDLGDLSPIIVPISYDIGTLDAPPSPAGFLEELDAMKRIRADYEARVQRLKADFLRRDRENMANAMEARPIEPGISAPLPREPVRRSRSVRDKMSLRGKIHKRTSGTRSVLVRHEYASLTRKRLSKIRPRKLRVLKSSSAWKRWKS
ncbi:uncharacterized protein SCHCODRAFT_01345250 [Schizophyllum commune H4-8]|uniref:Uncharacterized protein n=1 Tax=Schizophyllum commune (strain H4-8 / FGSC 9210) TaxID=578458 RepID=D8PVN2_SCHCM|nr:uncharacterized protein SCHCODRAFT_01345250 [Schizophyllum commune H4-8]KAI5900282.1 hypothetical protein SCHCODRAFT_01345250 [Schizophyllum commune H4-8]